jgi:hypothetical protein
LIESITGLPPETRPGDVEPSVDDGVERELMGVVDFIGGAVSTGEGIELGLADCLGGAEYTDGVGFTDGVGATDTGADLTGMTDE